MADTGVTYEKGKLYDLELLKLRSDPNQPRKYIDPQALEELTASIAQHNVLEPILFRQEIGGDDPNSPESGTVTPESPVNQPVLYIVAGERRVEAAKKAGLTTIPAIFVEGNYAEIALVENLLRQDLTAIEEAEALLALAEEQKYTHEQLAGIIGKARTTITDLLSLNRLPLEIRDECRSNPKAVRTVLIEIARKKQDRGMLTAWNTYKAKLAKQAAGRTRQAKAEQSPDDVIGWVSRTVNKLDGLDTSAWPEEQKNTFNQTLMNLQESIQALLNPSEESNLA
jgi:ParB family chromosome partitioning protein